jgi:hypothetical protein
MKKVGNHPVHGQRRLSKNTDARYHLLPQQSIGPVPHQGDIAVPPGVTLPPLDPAATAGSRGGDFIAKNTVYSLPLRGWYFLSERVPLLGSACKRDPSGGKVPKKIPPKRRRILIPTSNFTADREVRSEWDLARSQTERGTPHGPPSSKETADRLAARTLSSEFGVRNSELLLTKPVCAPLLCASRSRKARFY